jgi:riboflavin synthase
MFTGIIDEIGTVESIKQDSAVYLSIRSRKLLPMLTAGSSINVNGACLTVVTKDDVTFKVQLIPATREKTAFKTLQEGDRVNLERPRTFGEPLVGGIVSGLVDGVGVVTDYIQQTDNWRLRIKPPEKLMKYLVEQGGIVINGVGLHVTTVFDTEFETALYSYIIGNTTIGKLKKEALLNLEISNLARYIVPTVERMLAK